MNLIDCQLQLLLKRQDWEWRGKSGREGSRLWLVAALCTLVQGAVVSSERVAWNSTLTIFPFFLSVFITAATNDTNAVDSRRRHQN